MSDEHFAKLKTMYLNAPCNEFYVPDISIYRGASSVTITVRPKMLTAGGALQSSVCFKALNDAAYYAVNSLVKDTMVVATSFNCYFMRQVTSGVVLAEGKVKSIGSDILLAEAVLTDAAGEPIARGSGSYSRGRLKLTPEMGYKL